MDSGQLSAQARLLITGHSLGGALAVLAAFDIRRAMPDFRVEMYTYGTPYPGNQAYAREFNELLPDTWHVIHEGVGWARANALLLQPSVSYLCQPNCRRAPLSAVPRWHLPLGCLSWLRLCWGRCILHCCWVTICSAEAAGGSTQDGFKPALSGMQVFMQE